MSATYGFSNPGLRSDFVGNSLATMVLAINIFVC